MRFPSELSPCLAPLMLAACAVVPLSTAGLPDTAALLPYGQTWSIVSAGGMDRPQGVLATLSRTPQGIGGGGGCNLYFGEAEFGRGWLDFRNIGGTEMACPEPIMSYELHVLAALEAADGVAGAPGGPLTLMAQGRPVARLAPARPAVQ